MWVKIKCPACQTESSSSLPTSSYKGHYRCWKCRALFAVEVDNGELISYQPITENELEEIKAKQEAEKKGLPYTPKAAPAAPAMPPPQAAPSTPLTPPPQAPSVTPDFLKELGRPKDKPGVAQGIEYTKPQAAPEAPVMPPQASSVCPKILNEPVLPKEKDSLAPCSPNPATNADALSARPPVPKPPEPKVEVSGSGGKTVKIDSFNFGFIVVNGKQYGYDVAILPDGRVSEREPGRGRIGSHSITGSHLEPLVRANPEVILVGTGIRGMARLSEQRTSNIDIRVMSSPEAVREFNKLAAEGKRVAALIHITC